MSIFRYNEEKLLSEQFYYNNDNIHRKDNPAYIEYYDNGKTITEIYYENDKQKTYE